MRSRVGAFNCDGIRRAARGASRDRNRRPPRQPGSFRQPPSQWLRHWQRWQARSMRPAHPLPRRQWQQQVMLAFGSPVFGRPASDPRQRRKIEWIATVRSTSVSSWATPSLHSLRESARRRGWWVVQVDMNIELKLTVEDLNARYAQAIDDNKLEAWPDFFTEQGRYRVTTAENFERGLPIGIIYATSRAMLRDRVRSLREANVYEAQRYRHVIGVPLIASAGGSAVRAQTSFIVARVMHSGETTLFATGRYHDHVVLDDGEARFAEKIVILDSRLIDTLLAIPL